MLRPLKYCSTIGCSVKVERGKCAAHAAAAERQRPNADIRAWYHTPEWQSLKAQVRAEEPCCRQCWAEGIATAGTQTDHIQPHRGNRALFFNRGNLQNLCETHHAQKTRRGE
jgi:5-methylcytosine-specific restriction protein A